MTPRPPSNGTAENEVWAAFSALLIRYYTTHRAVFIGINALLTAANVYTGAPWWALWPLLITGAIFTLHFLIYSAVTVDDDWVEQRAADLYDKSYDQGHIDAIADRSGLDTVARRRDRTSPAISGPVRRPSPRPPSEQRKSEPPNSVRPEHDQSRRDPPEHDPPERKP